MVEEEKRAFCFEQNEAGGLGKARDHTHICSSAIHFTDKASCMLRSSV